MRITSKGQVTIPLRFRRELGLLPDTDVEFDVSGGALRVRKARQGSQRGRRLVAHMRGRGSVRMTTDQIMALTRK